MTLELILLIAITGFVGFLVFFGRKIKKQNDEKKRFEQEILKAFPNADISGENSPRRTILFSSGKHEVKIYTKEDLSQKGKYTSGYKYLIEFSNLSVSDREMIEKKSEEILGLKSKNIGENKLLINISGIEDYDRLLYFLINYSNEKVF